MFEALAKPVRGRPSLRQLLFPLFFGSGVLLNFICMVNRPPHTHHGIWWWLSLLAIALMLLGVGFNFREVFAARAARRSRVVQP